MAFTLIELLVVVAIIAILAAMLLPVLGKAKDTALLAQCTGTLRGMVTANMLYADDNDSFTVHGIYHGNWGPNLPYNDTFYFTTVFDDDWGDSRTGTRGDVNCTQPSGEQNICGVGQLMLHKYLPEVGAAVACPRVSGSEPDKPWGGKMAVTIEDVQGRLNRPYNGGGYWCNWKEDFLVAGNPYLYDQTNYMVRGPYIRLEDKGAAGKAIFADGEMDWHVQFFSALVTAGASPLIGWSRTHLGGFNTGYLDGHVAFYKDPDRRKAFFSGEGYNYGSGSAMAAGAFDEP